MIRARKQVLLATGAGPELGLGHLTRCSALAAQLRKRDLECWLVGAPVKSDFSSSLPPRRIEAGLVWDRTRADLGRFEKLLASQSWGGVVVDHPNAGFEYQKLVLETKTPWLQFDCESGSDLLANLVVNANPGCEEQREMRPEQRLLLGPQFAILRPEFSLARAKRKEGMGLHLAISFGGGDDRGAMDLALQALVEILPLGLTVTIIAGPAHPGIPLLRDRVKRISGRSVSLEVNPPSVSDLLSQADLVLLAGGTMTFEAAALGLPMALIAIAGNQVKQSQGWERLGAANFLGEVEALTGEAVAASLQELIDDQPRRRAMSEVGSVSCDGNGGARVADAFLKLISQHREKT
ncbi:MAG: hypothetical protein AAF662_08860 [Pseudomonadota bacterium]